MNSDIPFDLARLLQPLAADNRCGEDLHYDAVYDRIVELARGEPDGLPMGVWERETKKSDWNGVASLCYEALITRSKDLQVVAWWGEALSHLYGVRGIALGWRAFSGLAIQFWDDIHPRIAEGDIELRLRPVHAFVRQTGQWLTSNMPSGPSGGDPNTLSGISWPQERASLQELIADLVSLQAVLSQHLDDESPTLNGLCELARNRLAILGTKFGSPEASPDPNSHNVAAHPNAGPQGRVNTREMAYATILEVAQYLGKTEPHSPVPLILEAIASWRDCPLSELLVRMPKEDASLYELVKFFKKT